MPYWFTFLRMGTGPFKINSLENLTCPTWALRSSVLAATSSFLGPQRHTSEFLALWPLGWNGSQWIYIPEDSWLELFDSLAKHSFPIPPNNAGFFSGLAQRKSQSLFSFWLIGDSLATNNPLCVFSLLQGFREVAGGWPGWDPEENSYNCNAFCH